MSTTKHDHKQDGASDAAMARRLNTVLDKAIHDQTIVGAVVLVARDGEVIYQRAAGLADREANRAMEPEAIFLLASVTKPIVSSAAMRLVDDGVLSLDDPVTKWLPDFRPKLADGREPAILIRHLLTHTSGLSYRFQEDEGSDYHALDISDGLDSPGRSMEDNLARLAQTTLKFEPGARWQYSLAIDVLGAVIAAATGADLKTAIRQMVTRPLGMTDTEFAIVDPSRLVTHYADGDPAPVPMGDAAPVIVDGRVLNYAPGRLFHPDSYPSGGGGMAGTAGDVLRWCNTMLAGGSPILKPATVKDMMTNQLAPGQEIDDPGWGWGLCGAVLLNPGAAETPQPAGTVHWGGAYGHNWFIDPVNRLTFVQCSNTAFAGVNGEFPDALRNAVYE